MRRKRILFVVSNLKVGGGAEKSVTMLLKGLKDYYDVEVLTFYDFEKEYPYSVKRHSFGYKYTSSLLCKAYRLLFLFPLKLRKFLKKKKYDLVVSNAEDANVTCLISKKYFQNYKLWTVIRNDVFDKKHTYKKFNFLQKSADKVVVLTKALQMKCPFDSVVLENALDFDEVQRKRKEEIPRDERALFDKKTILMVGRFAKQKNHSWFFKVFEKIKDVNLLLVGNGPLEEKLKEEAQRNKNKDNIHFLGTKENVYAYLDKANVFALPSLHEGMPRVLMEALACGCICVSNDCETGPRELLEYPLNEPLEKYKKAKYGYIVPMHNEKEFEKALKDALKNGKKIKPDERYTIRNITKKWVRELKKDKI